MKYQINKDPKESKGEYERPGGCNCEQEAIDKGNWKCSKQVCDMNVVADEKL